MKLGKVYFGLAIMVSLTFVGCPMSDPSFELVIPPNPPFEGLPSGYVTVQRPGYEKYWPMGGYVQVDMTMEAGVITEVFIHLSHDDPFLAREIIEYWGFHEINGPGWMVERNTVELDIVTGATATSMAVLEAAAAAVEYIRTNTEPLPTIILDREFLIMSAGTSETINARVTLLDVFDLAWSSSDTRVATVRNGVVRAGITQDGFATITASDSEGRVTASTVVFVHGAPDEHGMVRVRRVAIGGRHDPLAAAARGAANVWLVDDGGFLAMGKDIVNSSEYGAIPPTSSWYIMRTFEEPFRFGLRNVYSGNYLNVDGITRGTSNETFVSSQPRILPFQNRDSFFWEFLPVFGGGYNIVSRGTLRGPEDAANSRAGALSNQDFPQAYWPPPTPYVPMEDQMYAISITGNIFMSEPCMDFFPYKLVQWRFDTDWETALSEDAFVFDILNE